MTSIRTPSGDWTLGELLGSGGYGRVHAARSLDGREAAIKLVPKEAGAERELLFADDLRGVPNVMPVVDTGETETDLVLVMPLAKGSLREYLGRLGRPLTQAEALPILIAIARALEALAGGERAVVHRDLKPENVLFDEDEWRLADFGIARYVAAATSQLTFRYSTTQYYRAPEQWRDEDATSKTDVYAFGLIGHELLTGSRPFDDTQLRHRHLHQDPPIITSVTPHLAAVIERCLAKDPRARPTASALRKSLAGLTSTTPPSVGLAVLQQANLTETSRMAQAIRHESVARSDSDRRAALLSAAAQQLRHISRALRSAIVAAAPAASPCSSVERPSAYAKAPSDYDGIATAGQTDASVAWALQLGKAVLQVASLQEDATALGPLDVVASCNVALVERSGDRDSAWREHSLWFCDARTKGEYGWFEAAFVADRSYRPQISTVGTQLHTADYLQEVYELNRQSRPRPGVVALGPGEAGVAEAVGRLPGPYKMALDFTELTVEALGGFVDRWAGWFAAAAQGGLYAQRELPTPAAIVPQSPVDLRAEEILVEIASPYGRGQSDSLRWVVVGGRDFQSAGSGQARSESDRDAIYRLVRQRLQVHDTPDIVYRHQSDKPRGPVASGNPLAMAYRRLAPSRLPDGRTYEEHIYRTASSDDLAVVELRTAGLRGHGELLVAEAVVVRGGAFKTGRLSSSRFVPSPVFKEWLDSHHRNFRPTGPPAALTPEGPFRFE